MNRNPWRLMTAFGAAVGGVLMVGGGLSRWYDATALGLEPIEFRGTVVAYGDEVIGRVWPGWAIVGLGLLAVLGGLLAVFWPSRAAVVPAVAGLAGLGLSVLFCVDPTVAMTSVAQQLGGSTDMFGELTVSAGLVVAAVGSALATCSGAAGLVLSRRGR
ncbi:hypothetical protein [Gordonia neofelifaecis]|uniref:Uncharacterized protein n=1 Tax=Gordonia neofelifaecis NRRL B-59395 TaxID=644548 RepID=F1YIH5_9ACTN|nr:hypothetical protein [Gordonia neofelifaecis]EGD55729.1 hypothetical protein SCNU_08448 [Gordonia neofelifaecis NRRL B-59395]